MSSSYNIVEISDNQNEISSLYKELNDLKKSNSILRHDIEKIKKSHIEQLTEIRNINDKRIELCKKYFIKIIINSILLALLSPILIGQGYLTEMIFTNVQLNIYQNWQIFFMKFAIICTWIGVAQNLFFYRENNSKKSENNIEQV